MANCKVCGEELAATSYGLTKQELARAIKEIGEYDEEKYTPIGYGCVNPSCSAKPTKAEAELRAATLRVYANAEEDREATRRFKRRVNKAFSGVRR